MPGAMLPTRCICGAEMSSRSIFCDRCEEVEIRLEEEWEAEAFGGRRLPAGDIAALVKEARREVS